MYSQVKLRFYQMPCESSFGKINKSLIKRSVIIKRMQWA